MQILGRVVGPKAHIGICRQMKNEFAAVERGRQRVLVEQVALHELEALI